MTLDELKAKVEGYREDLKEKSGKGCVFSEGGPANMGLIDALASVLEAQEVRIAGLEQKVAQLRGST